MNAKLFRISERYEFNIDAVSVGDVVSFIETKIMVLASPIKTSYYGIITSIGYNRIMVQTATQGERIFTAAEATEREMRVELTQREESQ